MDFKKGMVVLSRAGRDSGSPLVITEIRDGFIYVCDGKERPLENPKRKNPKHLAKTNRTISLEEITNRKLRAALRELNAKECE